MKTTAQIKRKLQKQFESVSLSGSYFSPPVLINCLYQQLMIEYMAKCGLLQNDIRAIMVLSVLGGLSRHKVIKMSGLHHQSLYPIFARLTDKGYVYTDNARPKKIYLTYAGDQIVSDVNRLWSDIIRRSAKEMDLKLS